VAQANALLGASYRLYRHTETNEIVLRTISYALPAVLHEHVQTVAPTTYFGSPRVLRQKSQLVPNGTTLPKGDLELQNASTDALGSGTSLPVPASCSSTITPRCLRRLYKTERYVPRVPRKNKLGIAGYLGESTSQSDLKVFMTLFRPRAVGARISVKSINGGINDQSDPGSEVRALLPAMVFVTQACNPTG
jgi:tripeptidyl-peptidase I